MDRQLNLDLHSDAERVAELVSYLRPVGLAQREVSALAVIFGLGAPIQIGDHSAIRWSGAKGEAARFARQHGLADCSPNTFLSACADLESRRLIGVLRTTKPWTYVLSLQAIARLEPPPDDPLAAIAALPIFRVDQPDARSSPVNPGQGVRVRDSRSIQNPCTVDLPVERDRDTAGSTLVDRMRRPWDRAAGLTSLDLQQAVTAHNLEPIRALWREAKVLEWVTVSDDTLLRFLTIAHHCGSVSGLANRMAALTARVKRNCDVQKIPHRSEDWAAAVIRDGNRDQVLREADAHRRKAAATCRE